MNTLDRKKIVAALLSSSKQAAVKEAMAIKTEKAPSREFVYTHLKRYILAKFMLEGTCAEDNLRELTILSLERTMKLDKSLIRDLDQAAPCDHATSESTKKVLLLYAIQRDLEIKPKPSDLTEAVTVYDLSDVVYAALTARHSPKSKRADAVKPNITNIL